MRQVRTGTRVEDITTSQGNTCLEQPERVFQFFHNHFLISLDLKLCY